MMRKFTRSKSRARVEQRDKDQVSKKWLVGIPVGNWNLGLNFEDESVVNSNAIMVDRPEPNVGGMARSKVVEFVETRGPGVATSYIHLDLSNDSVCKVEGAGRETSSGGVYPGASAIGTSCPEPNGLKKSTSQMTPLRDVSESSELANEAKAKERGVATTKPVRWSLIPAKKETNMEMAAATAMVLTRGSLDHQGAGGSYRSNRCVAVGSLEVGHLDGSREPSTTSCLAKGDQGAHGGPPGPLIGMPSTPMAPTHLSDTSDKDQAGNEREEKERGREQMLA
ncbi:hypothetical protein DRE_00931 [Drechslerella stenobrocha 248]|uniref:Uncharacterized protein n=1 Tax=Drechslerella stenobrocha 248 TaxID=1043628 RepID=W7HXM1_9PEZI|nr:hypothetical protein DRE_00931 [Drechslerella stenobrocha 248]